MTSPENNPANKPEKHVKPKGFQPMAIGGLKMEVPDKPGYHRRWIRGDAGRINKAMRAGYTFVDSKEVDLNNFDLGGDAKTSGNTDLGGSRVSIVSGDGSDETGQPGRMYLMECPLEFYEASRKIVEDRNDDIAEALKGGTIGSEKDRDVDARYVDNQRTKVPNMFTKKTSR